MNCHNCTIYQAARADGLCERCAPQLEAELPTLPADRAQLVAALLALARRHRYVPRWSYAGPHAPGPPRGPAFYRTVQRRDTARWGDHFIAAPDWRSSFELFGVALTAEEMGLS